jgi:hypothetical protein
MPSSQEIVDDLADSGMLLSIAIAGGGASGITDLLSCSGCSKFLFDFQVPYGKGAFDSLAGHLMDLDYKYVTSDAAERLARGILAQQLRKEHNVEDRIRVGVGVTSKLTTGPDEREGREHVVYFSVVLRNVDYTELVAEVSYNPIAESRLEQESEVAGALLAFLLNVSQQVRLMRIDNELQYFNPSA